MNNYLPLLQNTTLFAGLSAAELSTLLSRLGASVRSYGKGEALVLAGEPSRRVGIVLSGELEAYRPAPGGARIPSARVEPGGVFGDVLGGAFHAVRFAPTTMFGLTLVVVLAVHQLRVATREAGARKSCA